MTETAREPRVLLVSPVAVQGGAERSLVALAERLRPLGFETEVVLLERGPLEQWLDEVGCTPLFVESGRLRQLPSVAKTVRRLRTLIDSRGIDLVVSNMTKGHLYGGSAARLANVPAIWWDQGIADGGLLEQLAGRVPAEAIVCDSAAAAAARRRVTGRRAIEAVHLGLSLARVEAARGSGLAIRRRLGWEDNRIVGIVGRLQRWKRQDVFIRAAARLAADDPSLRFLVVGGAILGTEGSYPDELRELAASVGLDERIHFAGHQAEVYPWLDAVDVFTHTSAGEPFGMVIIEAMALGKPVVAAADGGPLEIVEPQRSGLLVPPGDDEGLAAAIRRILADPALAAQLAVGAERRVRSTYSDERMAADFARILGRISTGQTKPAIRPPRAHPATHTTKGQP